ncbi:DUF819 domain-containing protein [Pseudoflavitalea rhizosphaerae]|uniref:DUF819 family protein n=1 Tax=Pseudoflavitalea rhizosphaerae TaxID=1884793 RepID=UPI000F8EBA7D|nr:DUF819 family protein [Pseudoflavitalea rhizosphaerae]
MVLLATAPLISSDIIVFAILVVFMAFVQKTSTGNNRFFKRFYFFCPPLLALYFFPGILNTANIVSGENSKLYDLIAQYLLPAGLVLFTLSVDMKELWKLRKKAGAMFLAGAIGVIIGGPLTILIVKSFAPGLVGGEGPDAVWRGLATVAGSWIGGSANLAALNEVFKPSPQLFSTMVVLDAVMANIWLAILLYGVGKNRKINKFFRAEDKDVEEVKEKMQAYQQATAKIPSLSDSLSILAVAFGGCGLAYLIAGPLVSAIQTNFPYLEKFSLTSNFFWVVILCTSIGVILSFTPLRKLEGAGASRVGTVFLYLFITAVGLQMDILGVFRNSGLFLVGFIWLCFHALAMIIVGRMIKAPYFFFAVSGEANLGGAVQASLIASAFHPALAPVGVLLSVLGYVLGNYGGYICGLLMQWVS